MSKIIDIVRKLIPENPVNRVNSIDYIVGGVFIYTLTNYLLLFYLPQFLWWILDLIAVGSFLYGIATAKLRMHVDMDVALCTLFLLLYAVIIIVLGIIDPAFNIPHIVTNQHYVLPYILPLLVFVRLNSNDIRKIYMYLYLGCFLSFVYYLIYGYSFIFNTEATHQTMNDVMEETSVFGGFYFQLAKVSVGAPFASAIALYYISGNYPNHGHKYVIIFVVLACVLSAMAFGRRTNSAFNFLILLSPIIVKSLYGRHKLKHIILILLIVAVGYLSFFAVLEFFPIMESRWDTDSRSELFGDFFRKFDTFEMIVGRGLHGTYVTTQDDLGERNMIENGHLDIILRTGLLYLIPYMYIIIAASAKGVVRSCSRLITGAGVFLFIKFLAMAVHIQIFDLSDMMLFFCVSLCASDTSRKSYMFLNRKKIILLLRR